MAEYRKSESGKSFSRHVVEKKERARVEKPKTVSRTLPNRAYMRVKSNYSGTRFVEGTRTGRKYVWNGYGSEVDVLVDDIGDWINLRMGGGCCGGGSQIVTYFEIVGG